MVVVVVSVCRIAWEILFDKENEEMRKVEDEEHKVEDKAGERKRERELYAACEREAERIRREREMKALREHRDEVIGRENALKDEVQRLRAELEEARGGYYVQ